MRQRLFASVAFMALLAAPLAVAAQDAAAGTKAGKSIATRGSGQFTPIRALVRHQAELGLSAEQISRLEAIQQRVTAQNQPLLEQLRAAGAWQPRGEAGARGGQRMRQMTPEQREQMRERMRNMSPDQREQLRQQMRERHERTGEGGPGMRGARQIPSELQPVVQQLRENSRAAFQEAQAVLTDDQQARSRELMRQHRGQPRMRSDR